MTVRLWAAIVPLACTLIACGDEGGAFDGGARPDAGFFVAKDSGIKNGDGSLLADAVTVVNDDAAPSPDAVTPANDDAAAMVNDDAAAMPEADAGVVEMPDAMASAPDALGGGPDAVAGAPDAAVVVNADAAVAPRDATVGNADAGGGLTQGGGVLVSEFMARSPLEWIEISNTTGQPVNLAVYTIGTRATANMVLRAVTDANGASGTAITLPAGGALLGVANPAAGMPIPPLARFVIGTPAQLGANWLGDSGDVITLRSPGGSGDLVDFMSAATDPANPIGANQYPLIDGVSTQLDVAVVSAGGELGNDNGGVWCAPLFRGGTPNATNLSCGEMVISELTYDYASPATGGDDGYEFIEVAGHAGGSLTNVFIGFVEGTGTTVGASNGPSIGLAAARVPLDGLYVVADRAPALMTSFVANADQIEEIGSGSNSSLENGPDAIQLYRQNVGGTFTLLDALSYGVVTGINDTTRGLPFMEGTPVADFSTTAYPINYARSDDEVDSNVNVADFSYAPTATPGARNGSSALVVSAIIPPDAIAGTTVTVTISGSNFTDSMNLGFSQVPAPTITNSAVTVQNQLSARVTYPAAGSGMAERVNVTVTARPESGRSATVTGGFTWTTAANETGAANECDFCNLQFPLTLNVAAGATTPQVFGRIYEVGRTDTTVGSAAPNILAQVGYGPAGSDPRTRNWTWTRATFNVEAGNNDEYVTTFVAPAVNGTYAYTYRFSLDGGLTWSYADTDGAGSNAALAFTPGLVGVMVVQ